MTIPVSAAFSWHLEPLETSLAREQHFKDVVTDVTPSLTGAN
jgi:hypothetical protein